VCVRDQAKNTEAELRDQPEKDVNRCLWCMENTKRSEQHCTAADSEILFTTGTLSNTTRCLWEHDTVRVCVCVCGGGQITRFWLSGLACAGALHRPISVMTFSSPPIGTRIRSVYRTERRQWKDVQEDTYI